VTAARPRHAVLLAVVGLTLLAFALRLPGVGARLPHVPNVDEVVLYRQASSEAARAADPARGGLENSYPRLLGRMGSLVVADPVPGAAATVEQHLAEAARPVRALRLLFATIACLLVPLTFGLARRLWDERVALTAAFLVATSLLLVWYAPQARPHPSVAVTSILTVIAALDLRRDPRIWRYVLTGALAGVAGASLHSGLSALAPLGVAHALRARRSGWRDHGAFVLALVCSALVAWPFWPASTLEGNGGGGLLGHGLLFSDIDGGGTRDLPRALLDYEPVMAFVGLAALATVLVRAFRGARITVERRADLAVPLAHVVAYLAPLMLFTRSFQRFLIPVIPYLACAVAWFLWELVRGTQPARRRMATVAVVALLVLNAVPGLKATWLRLRLDSETRAALWLAEHEDRATASIVLAPTLELPLVRTAESLPRVRLETRILFPLWTRYQASLPADVLDEIGWRIVDLPLTSKRDRENLADDPQAWLARLSGDLVVMEDVEGDRRPILRTARSIFPGARTLARFGPAPEFPGPVLYHLDGPLAPERWFWLRILCANEQGPRIEIFRR